MLMAPEYGSRSSLRVPGRARLARCQPGVSRDLCQPVFATAHQAHRPRVRNRSAGETCCHSHGVRVKLAFKTATPSEPAPVLGLRRKGGQLRSNTRAKKNSHLAVAV